MIEVNNLGDESFEFKIDEGKVNINKYSDYISWKFVPDGQYKINYEFYIDREDYDLFPEIDMLYNMDTNGNYIDFHSFDSDYDSSSILHIDKINNDKYLVEFIRENILRDDDTINVNINNQAIIDMYNRLVKKDFNYHQISIDEFLYSEKKENIKKIVREIIMNLKKRNESMKEFFDRKIDSYDEVHSSFMQTKNEITNNLDININKILDLGAGTGLELIALFEKFPNVLVDVIDISPKMLQKLLQRSFKDNINAICGDFFEIPFGKDYDAVISTSALHHFLKSDKRILYKKVYDSLKEDGLFLNCDKVAKSIENEEEAIKKYYLDEESHIDTPLAITNEIDLLQSTGFKNIQVLDAYNEGYKLIKAKK